MAERKTDEEIAREMVAENDPMLATVSCVRWPMLKTPANAPNVTGERLKIMADPSSPGICCQFTTAWNVL